MIDEMTPDDRPATTIPVTDTTSGADAGLEALSAVRPVATSSDGAVTVTVTTAGALHDISFGPAASALDVGALGPLIVATSDQARRRAAAHTRAAMVKILGENHPALALVNEQLPDPQPAGVEPHRREHRATPGSARRADVEADDDVEAAYTRRTAF
jgi:DNA-binding protein YbaB